MKEFLSTLFQAVIVAVVPVCATFAVKGLKELAVYLKSKTTTSTTDKYMDMIMDAVSTAVTFTSQKYVDSLKKSGEFGEESQKRALQIALAEAQTLLTEEAKNFITETYGDILRYLEGRIEAEVRTQKILYHL